MEVVAMRIGKATLFAVFMSLAACNSGFTDEDIAKVKESIRDEFDKRPGVKVVEVQMLKESPNKLMGFVKAKAPLFGEITKSCSATMGEGHEYLWRCE
jgi:hypothetical protein